MKFGAHGMFIAALGTLTKSLLNCGLVAKGAAIGW